MAGGRKSLKDEIKVVQYMTELAEPTFKFIKLMHEAGEKADKKWATEQMMKLYAKALPTEVTGEDGEPIKYQLVSYADTPIQIPTSPISDTANQSV